MASSGTKRYFKGFLIEARNAGNLREIVGSFKLINSDISQLLQCDNKVVSDIYWEQNIYTNIFLLLFVIYSTKKIKYLRNDGTLFLSNKYNSLNLLYFQYWQNSAVSHTSESHKTEVQVIWVAPPDSPSSVQFM